MHVREPIMELFKQLFSSDVGLLSAATIGFIVLMGVYFVWFFGKKIREDEARNRR